MNIKIGAKIKELRKRQSITQEQLAGALGLTNQAISRWESESGYPDIEYIIPIANFFKVTANYLLDDGGHANWLKIGMGCDENKGLYCSFCGKDHTQVKKTVVAPNNINICNECVLLCVDTMMSVQ